MVVHSRFQYIFLSIQQWLLLTPDRPCDQHVRLTRSMSLTVKHLSTKGLLFQLAMALCNDLRVDASALRASPPAFWLR
jgi:hypothetical protein